MTRLDRFWGEHVAGDTREWFWGICEVCGDSDLVTKDKVGRSICHYCVTNGKGKGKKGKVDEWILRYRKRKAIGVKR
jgi:hypothetical protein